MEREWKSESCFVCKVLNIPHMQILVMENFQIQSCEIPLEIFWQLMTFDISRIILILTSSSRTLFVASPFLKIKFHFFHAHTRSCAVWNEIGFYLMLVIDCEKLISSGCADIARYSPQECRRIAGQTVLSSIKKSFPPACTTCERMMIYEIQ